ncbi:MAG: hypothetical protein ABJA98_03930 [Acidobacteriota bacterium]
MSAETTIADCLRLIEARYVAVPGLSLTGPELERLWRLDPVSCAALCEALIDIRYLRRTREGAYERERT